MLGWPIYGPRPVARADAGDDAPPSALRVLSSAQPSPGPVAVLRPWERASMLGLRGGASVR